MFEDHIQKENYSDQVREHLTDLLTVYIMGRDLTVISNPIRHMLENDKGLRNSLSQIENEYKTPLEMLAKKKA
jgi:hypothetical protein